MKEIQITIEKNVGIIAKDVRKWKGDDGAAMSQEVIEETMNGKMNLKVAGDGTMMYHQEEMIVAEMTKAQEAIEGDMNMMMRNDANEEK